MAGPAPVLKPRPGFNWMLVTWGAPDQRRTVRCSYCGDPFPDEEADPGFIPLIMWNTERWCAEFCDHCQVRWWGMERFDVPPEYDER